MPNSGEIEEPNLEQIVIKLKLVSKVFLLYAVLLFKTPPFPFFPGILSK